MLNEIYKSTYLRNLESKVTGRKKNSGCQRLGVVDG
jgi:hypothetical protein